VSPGSGAGGAAPDHQIDILVNNGSDDGDNRGAGVEYLLAQVQVVLHLIMRYRLSLLIQGEMMDRTEVQLHLIIKKID
jgi:hypothetical protein